MTKISIILRHTKPLFPENRCSLQIFFVVNYSVFVKYIVRTIFLKNRTSAEVVCYVLQKFYVISCAIYNYFFIHILKFFVNPLPYDLSSNIACHKRQQGRSYVEPFHDLTERSKLCKSNVSFDM